MRPDPSPALVSNVRGGNPDAICSTLSVTASGSNEPVGGGALADGEGLPVGCDDGLVGALGLALPGTAVALGSALSVGAGSAVGSVLLLAVVLGEVVGPAPVGDAVCAAVHAAVSKRTAISAIFFTRAWCRNRTIGADEREG